MKPRDVLGRLHRIELALAGSGAATADDREFHDAFGAFWDDRTDKAKGDRMMAALAKIHGAEGHASFLRDLENVYGDGAKQHWGEGVQ